MYVHQIVRVYSTGTAYIEHTFSSKKKAEEQLAFIRKIDEQDGYTWTDVDAWGEPVRRYMARGTEMVFGWKVIPKNGDVNNTIFYFIEKHEVM